MSMIWVKILEALTSWFTDFFTNLFAGLFA